MSVVFDLADVDDRAGLRPGHRQRRRRAEIRANARGAGGLSRHGGRRLMLDVRDLHAYLRQEPHPAGRRPRGGRRRDREPARPQRRRPLDDAARRSWAMVVPHGRRSSSRARADRGPASPTRSPTRASATCRRTATSSPALTVRAEPRARASSAGRKAAAGASRTCYQLFPLLRERCDDAGGRPFGRRATDAHHVPHADGRSRARSSSTSRPKALRPKLVERMRASC